MGIAAAFGVLRWSFSYPRRENRIGPGAPLVLARAGVVPHDTAMEIMNEGGESFGVATMEQPDALIPLIIPTPFDCAAESERLSRLCEAETDPVARQAIAFQIVDLLNSGRL